MKVFITGGTSGLGLALAEEYLNGGHTVGVCGRDLSKLPDDIKRRYPKIQTYQLSVTDRDKAATAISEFSCGELDIVVANAGIGMGKKVSMPNFERTRSVLETNVTGVINTFEPAIEVFLKQGYGHLVVVSSVAAFIGTPGAGPYCASKAAVLRLCESYSIDLQKYNIDVTVIAPGFIDTPLTKKNNHNMPFLMSAEKAAKRVALAIERKVPVYVFPLRMKMVITFLRCIPRFLYRLIMKINNYCDNNGTAK